MGKTDFTFKIAGEAGQGIASSGLVFSKIALRSGYFVFDFSEYPSLIRGGHNVYGARISSQEIHFQNSSVDFLVALNQQALDFHKTELSRNSAVILNSDKVVNAGLGPRVSVFSVPLIKLAKKSGGAEVMMNNVALGLTAFLLRVDFPALEQAIRETFSWATPEVIDLNIKVALAGFDFARENFKGRELAFSLTREKLGKNLLLSGNDAFCLGAIKAGCKFFAAYPMTPINSMIAYFAAKARELNIVYFQPEDEISAINSAIGASTCGLRSMVATSGGGFSLMVEALGMAGMTETPLVIVEGQRTGPSSGLPTWTGQGDLRFVLHSSQDDFPKVVLAPGDAEECFWQMIGAFNLAEKYQLPVIVLADKYLCESRKTFAIDDPDVKIDRGLLSFSKDYQRYRLTKNGISPRAIVGQSESPIFISSYEHDQSGFASEDPANKKAMMEKRMKKMETLKREMPRPKVFGSKKAEIGFISWGSNKGSVLEAQKILKKEKIETKFLHLNFLNPFPAASAANFLKSCKKILLVEQNFTGQLGGLVQEKTGINIEDRLLKYDGRPILPEEIVKKIKKIL
ncbi:MAG: 2-oxoacid:acceptor oxidoreductase subunit alpha [bacterium]|nr:2-oxoacid:acceptor oxidoreductase subunit alpha [bacterium]